MKTEFKFRQDLISSFGIEPCVDLCTPAKPNQFAPPAFKCSQISLMASLALGPNLYYTLEVS